MSYLRPSFPLPLARPFFSPFFPISSRHHQPSASEALAGLPSYSRPRFPSLLLDLSHSLPFLSLDQERTRLSSPSEPAARVSQADKGSSSYLRPSLPLLLARPLFSRSSRILLPFLRPLPATSTTMATITFDAYTSPWASFEFVNWEEEPGNLELLPLGEDLSMDGRSATHSCASPSTPHRDSSPGCGVQPPIVSQLSHGNLQIVDLRDSANPPGDEQLALAVLPRTALLEELPNDCLKFQAELGGITSRNGNPSPGSRTRKSEAAPFSQDPALRDACPHSLPPQLNDYLDNPRGTYFPPEYDVRDSFPDFSWESDFPDSLPDCPAPPCSESVDTDQVPASPGAGAEVAKSEIVSLRDPPIENFPVFLLGVLIGVAMGSLPGQTSVVRSHPSNSQQPNRSRRHLELCASPSLHRDYSLVGERLVDATPPIAVPLGEPPYGSLETFRSPPSASYSHPPGHEHLAPATPPEPALLEEPSPNGSLQSRAKSARTTSQNDNPSPGSGHPTDSVKAKEDEYEDMFHPRLG